MNESANFAELYNFAINMTSGSENIDVLVKEYLIFRGFIQSAKQLDAELKGDRDKGFRAELLVERIIGFVFSHDLQSLKDFWAYLEIRIFSRLERQYHTSTKKIYFSILKYYVVYATTNGRPEKVSEFFSKMASELQPHPEWKDWFALPFIKHPETNDAFATCFTKQWQDALQLSLFNYLSVIFQSMPTPSLMDMHRHSAVQLRPESGRRKIKPGMLRGSMDMVDDFYTLSQSITVEEPAASKKGKSTVAKSFAKLKGNNSVSTAKAKGKSLITQAINSSFSAPQTTESSRLSSTATSSLPNSSLTKSRRPNSGDHNEMRQALLATSSKVSPSSSAVSYTSLLEAKEQEMVTITESEEVHHDYVISGQHTYTEHSNSITHAKFSKSGSVIASADIDHVIKVWTREVMPTTIATVISKSNVLSLEFVDSAGKLLLIGAKPDMVKIYETSTKRSLVDIKVAEGLSNTKISDLSVDLIGHNFVCSTLVNGTSSGLLSICSIATGTRQFCMEDQAIQSVEYFNYGNNLLAGCVDGTLKIFDVRQVKAIKTWKAHSGKIYNMQLSHDGLSCFTIDSDNTVSQWNLSSGRLYQSFSLHDGAAGPYVLQQNSHKQIQTPKDKVFALNPSNTHFLSCYKTSALIYKIVDGEVKRSLLLGGHGSPVVAVDWAAMDTDTCLAADMSGVLKLTTLLQ
ncbi:WD repeat-containing protein 91-like [Watersipora subatra]|uniref:WD repeat-containing protein 91-like n=1 Tax=Watersipora subatra TaxID=2589382 RepID=UPI00355B509F